MKSGVVDGKSLGGGLVIIMFRIQLNNRFICFDTAAESNDMEQGGQYTIPECSPKYLGFFRLPSYA